MTNWTVEEVHDSWRTAIAMALAVERGNGTDVAELWNAAEHKPSLIALLSKLPGIIARSVADHAGIELDLDQYLDIIARHAAHNPPTLNEGDQDDD